MRNSPSPALAATAPGDTPSRAPAGDLSGDGRDRATSRFRSFDGEDFGWRRWGSARPRLILLCLHGLSGAVEDYDYLASRLDLRDTALYSYDLRAMGRDARAERRGALEDRLDWSRDLRAFDDAVRRRHPGVPVAWYGESLGALIILQTQARQPGPELAGVALASPIVSVDDKLPWYATAAFSLGSRLTPQHRVEIGTLAGDADISGSEEKLADQLQRTPWAVHRYTLRTLGHVRTMAQRAPEAVRSLQAPLLVLHGGRDQFETQANVAAFLAAAPPVDITYHHYDGGHHLLLYDEAHRQRVAEDIERWLAHL